MKQLFDRIMYSDTIEQIMIVFLLVLYIAKGVIDFIIIPKVSKKK